LVRTPAVLGTETVRALDNVNLCMHFVVDIGIFYRGADKSLARPGMKQATTTEDFDVYTVYLLTYSMEQSPS